MKSRFYRYFKPGDYIMTCSGLARVTDIRFGYNPNTGKAAVYNFEVFYDMLLEKHIGDRHIKHSCDQQCWPDKLTESDALFKLNFLIDAYNKTQDIREAYGMLNRHINGIGDNFNYEQFCIDSELKSNDKIQSVINMNRFKAKLSGVVNKPKKYPKHWKCRLESDGRISYRMTNDRERHKKFRRKFDRRWDKHWKFIYKK